MTIIHRPTRKKNFYTKLTRLETNRESNQLPLSILSNNLTIEYVDGERGTSEKWEGSCHLFMHGLSHTWMDPRWC